VKRRPASPIQPPCGMAGYPWKSRPLPPCRARHRRDTGKALLAQVVAILKPVGHPARIAVAARQKIDNVDPLVPSSVGRVERQETRARSPGFLPWGSAVSDLFNQPRGDVLNKGVVVHFSDSKKSSTLSRASVKESAS
jgi:hypothetical protein